MEKTISLENINKFSLQEIYDYVLTKLKAQNGIAMNDAGECVFLTPCGKKCAVGHLITPAQHEKHGTDKLNSQGIAELLETLSIRLLRDKTKLLKELMSFHDSLLGVEDNEVIQIKLNSMATQFNLKPFNFTT